MTVSTTTADTPLRQAWPLAWHLSPLEGKDLSARNFRKKALEGFIRAHSFRYDDKKRAVHAKQGMAGSPLGRSTACSGTGSVVLDGACPGSDGDRHHAQTRGRVSVPRLHAPVSHGVSAVSSRTPMNNAGCTGIMPIHGTRVLFTFAALPQGVVGRPEP